MRTMHCVDFHFFRGTGGVARMHQGKVALLMGPLCNLIESLQGAWWRLPLGCIPNGRAFFAIVSASTIGSSAPQQVGDVLM